MFNVSSAHKVLIVNIFGIGDVLFTTPLISNLKKTNPNIKIGYLCNRRTEPVLRADPLVNKVFIYDRDEFYKVQKQSWFKYIQKVNGLIQEIRKEKYDLVLDVSMTDLMGFICWAAGIKERVGLAYKNRGRFLTKKLPFQGYERRHVVEYYLDLLRVLGMDPQDKNMRLTVSDDIKVWAKKFIKELGVKEISSVVIVPGGGASWGKEAFYKRWSPENYAKLADKIIEMFSADIILMGDTSEIELCQQVASTMKNRSFLACGKTNIQQFAAVAQIARLCVVNDGGPLHMAVAAGAKTVSIFGPVDEKVYGPYPVNSHIVVKSTIECRPCYHNFRKASCEHINCLKQLSYQNVMEQVERFL
ncbi:MAG: glycosyltransferase family 9 protein [Candidatus Omnitrophica bacterium]|nr:glycosyltransferase family 9 protein [Candidatus Omnitrophota bacterium]